MRKISLKIIKKTKKHNPARLCFLDFISKKEICIKSSAYFINNKILMNKNALKLTDLFNSQFNETISVNKNYNILSLSLNHL